MSATKQYLRDIHREIPPEAPRAELDAPDVDELQSRFDAYTDAVLRLRVAVVDLPALPDLTALRRLARAERTTP